MISMEELLKGKTLEQLTDEQRANVAILLERVNKVRAIWAIPMTVTNTVRTMEEHLAIYAKKGITDPHKIPMQSKHLHGAATDIADNGLLLTAWLKRHPEVLEECELWCEDGNSNWVHFQIQPFGSYHAGGTRWFKP